MMPCSRTTLQPPRPTLPPRLDQRGRSGQTSLLAHLQLGLENTLSTKGTPQDLRDYINKDHALAQVKALRLSNYCKALALYTFTYQNWLMLPKPLNNFSTLRVYKIMRHRDAMNHFHHNRNFLRRVQRTKSLLITESAAIRIGYNLARVYYFTHTARGTCDSPNRPELDKGILASTVPNKAQPLRVRPACAWRLSSTEDISKFSYT